MKWFRALNTAAIATLWGASLACGDGQQTDLATPTDDAPSIDVQDVMERVRRSYRQDGDGFVGGRTTYRVRVEEGRLQISPQHWEAVESDSAAPNVSGEVQVVSGAAATFETKNIARADLSFDLGHTTKIAEDGSIRVDRGVATERFINLEEGVEQLWEFDRAPSGEGDLVIRVSVDGQRYGGWNQDGHHFVDEASGVGVRYGVAKWIDAADRSFEVPVEYDDGQLVLTVAEHTLDSSAFPAVLDPVISAEIGLTSPASGPNPYPQRSPEIASDGTNFMVVWSDIRDGASFDIFGARVTPTRQLLDPNGIPINRQPDHQMNPDIAFDGTNYLVVWEDHSGADADIYGTRVTPAGGILDGTGTLVSGASGDQTQPSVDASGSNWVVTWLDARSGTNNVFFARVSAGGLLQDPIGRSIETGVEHDVPDIACGNTDCLIVYARGSRPQTDIYAARITAATGAVLGNVAAGNGTYLDLQPHVAYDGVSSWLIVWQRYNAGDYDIYGQRIAADGSIVDAAIGFPINERESGQQEPAVAFSGGRFFVVWKDLRTNGTDFDILGTYVQTGTVSNPNGFSVNLVGGGAHQQAVAVAGVGNTFLVVWEDNRTGNDDIMGTSVVNGVVGNQTGVVISQSANRQTAPTVAFNGTFYFIIFQDSRRSGGADVDLIGVRVRRNGLVADPAGIPITSASGHQGAPDIAYNTTSGSWLIVWSDRRSGEDDIWGALVSAGFGLQSTFPINTSADRQRFPRVAYNASVDQYLVAWMDRRNGDYDIFASRVDAAGTVLDGTGLVVGAQPGDQSRPDVASNGADWLVAWDDDSAGAGTEDIFGSIVSGAGSVGANFTVAAAANQQVAVRAEHDGTNFVVVWMDSRVNSANYDVRAARVSNAGVLLDAAGIGIASSAALNETRPDIGIVNDTLFGAPTWFIVWRQQTAPGVEQTDLVGRQFTTGGVAGAPAFTVSNASGNEDQPAVHAGRSDRAIVVYQRFNNSAALSSDRIYARTVQFP